MVTNSEVNEPPEEPASENERAAKAKSGGNFKSRVRARLQLVGGALASIAAVGAIAGGLVGYWSVWKTFRTEVLQDGQKIQREATARPDIAPRLSLVVLPFANLNNDPEQDYFADGITTDLTTDLGQMPDAFVIGRGTAFTYKNKQIDLRTLGRELSIRWAVQGAVQRNGDHVRVNASLTDLQNGQAIWSDRFDGDRATLVAMQDQITARLARSLNIELIQAESRRVGVDRNPDAVDFSMRGWAKIYEPRSKMQTAQAKEIFDQALRLDPGNVDAMLGKASCLVVGVINGWSASVSEDQRTAVDLADRALSKRPASAQAHVVKGEVLRYGHPEDAVREFDAALEIDPNFPVAYANRGQALLLSGRVREAFLPLGVALRMSPKDPFAFVWHYFLCAAHYHLHQYDEAIEECRRSINLDNSFWLPYAGLVSVFGATGQPEQAAPALNSLHKIRPDFTVERWRELGYTLSSNPQFRREFEEVLDGARKGGLPEQ
jgi:TolB-like protein/Tfp pilus assembly protein PilF